MGAEGPLAPVKEPSQAKRDRYLPNEAFMGTPLGIGGLLHDMDNTATLIAKGTTPDPDRADTTDPASTPETLVCGQTVGMARTVGRLHAPLQKLF